MLTHLTSDVKVDQIKQAIEQEIEREAHFQRSPPRVEITESETPTGEAFDFEDTEAQDEINEHIKTEPDEVVATDETNEEEIAESVTEIEEIFQVSEDGVNWKTIKKITTIRPEGTTEKIIILGGISCTCPFRL